MEKTIQSAILLAKQPLKSFSSDCLNAAPCSNFHLVSKCFRRIQTQPWLNRVQREHFKLTLGKKRKKVMFVLSYLRLGLQGQFQFFVVCMGHADFAARYLVKFVPALFGLALANQPQESGIFGPTHGTFIKRPIEQSHRKPHYWSHQ